MSSSTRKSPRLSNRNVLAIVVPPLVLALAMAVMARRGVPLGQGSFKYLYTPLFAMRWSTVPAAIPGIALIAWAIWLAGRARLGRKPAVLATAGVLWMGAWASFAIPFAVPQHQVNVGSESHDGAFVIETYQEGHLVPSGRDYIRGFPQRQRRSIEEMRGTRVLSNPPGITLLAFAIRDVWPEGWVEAGTSAMLEMPMCDEIRVAALGLKLYMVLTAFWLASAPVAYRAARRWLPPAGALAVMAVAVFAPTCLEFTPGKDVAQVFFAALTLLGVSMAVAAHDGSASAKPLVGGAIFGVTAAVGLLVGLLMAWVSLAAGVWAIVLLRSRGRDLARFAGAAVAGLAAGWAAIHFATGYELVSGSISVLRTFALVQPQIAVDRNVWLAIGLPIAVAFAPAGLFSALLLNGRSGRRWALLAITCGTLLVTYVVGVPYELPRLWSPFLPLLSLGAFLATPIARSGRPGAARVLSAVVALSLVSAVAHWAWLDPRESETRITQGIGVEGALKR